MKGYYIFEELSQSNVGIYKKIVSQCKNFGLLGIQCSPKKVDVSKSSLIKALKRIPFGPDNVNWNSIDVSDCDFLYIRKNLMTIHFVRFLKKVRKNNKNIKIVIEIPTYPYFKELLSFSTLFVLFRDYISSFFLKKYVDLVAVIGDSPKKVWGIPVIKIANGIDFDSIHLRNYIPNNNEIRVACAANFSQYHGIDFFLEGLERYYLNNGSENIQLYLGGKGNCYQSYFEKVNSSSVLKSHVCFLGMLNNDQLQKLYSNCDIGIVSLGYSRIGLHVNTTIKSKEYMGSGLPFITDTPIDVMENDIQEWVLKVRYGETPIDMEQVITFYNRIYKNKNLNELQEYFSSIRKYAIRRSDMKYILKHVVDYIK